MEKPVTRTFKTALRAIRRDQKMSLQELGVRIDSDASHIFKIEKGQDVTLSTMLKLARSLGVTVNFGMYVIAADRTVKRRTKPRTKS
jgi:transcriptional regulator with XRE-family HTH domain